MKRFITAIFFAIFYFLSIRVQARPRLQVPHVPEPYVASDRPGFNRCEDHTAPCLGRLLLVKNPQYSPVTVVVWCLGDPRTMTEGVIPAHSEGTFDVGTDKPGGLQAGDCSIARWSN